jgi:hypothetical protein
MALNWNDLERMKRVESRANALGFEFTSREHQWVDSGNAIHVRPKDDLLPIYSRDATFFSGSLESIECWLDGIEWARHYDDLLKVSHSKKRERQEQLVRNQHLMKTIKAGKLVEGVVGSTNINDLRLLQEAQFDEDEAMVYADDGGTGAGY